MPNKVTIIIDPEKVRISIFETEGDTNVESIIPYDRAFIFLTDGTHQTEVTKPYDALMMGKHLSEALRILDTLEKEKPDADRDV